MSAQGQEEGPTLLGGSEPSSFWQKVLQGFCTRNDDVDNQEEVVSQDVIQGRELLLELEESASTASGTTQSSDTAAHDAPSSEMSEPSTFESNDAVTRSVKGRSVVEKKGRQSRILYLLLALCCLVTVMFLVLTRTGIVEKSFGRSIQTSLATNTNLASGGSAVLSSTWTSALNGANSAWNWMGPQKSEPKDLSTWALMQAKATSVSQSANDMVVPQLQYLVSSYRSATDRLVAVAKGDNNVATPSDSSLAVPLKNKMVKMSAAAMDNVASTSSKTSAAVLAAMDSTTSSVASNLQRAKELGYNKLGSYGLVSVPEPVQEAPEFLSLQYLKDSAVSLGETTMTSLVNSFAWVKDHPKVTAQATTTTVLCMATIYWRHVLFPKRFDLA